MLCDALVLSAGVPNLTRPRLDVCLKLGYAQNMED